MSAELSGVPSAMRLSAADQRAAEGVVRDSSIQVGRDAVGNVFVTGEGNTVEVKLTVVVADTRLRAAEVPALENPYRGLDAFCETDSALFFGRDDLKTRLWIRLQALQRGHAPRLLPIVGPSGSGKSSLVRAGLLPELVRQPMEGMRHPTILVLRPGADPLRRLADVLGRFAATHSTAAKDLGPVTSADFVHRVARSSEDAELRLVIFVDQLEELFTECASETARSTFLTTLAHAVTQPDGLVSVIFAMRNDFAVSLRTPEAFAAAVREQPFRVSQMSKEQLIEAIAQPAKVLGHPWPPGLVENLVLQCEGRVGALPLLQYALKRLWSEHVAGRLEESRWSSRLIEDFVAQVAEELYEGSGTGRARETHQRIIRRAFLSMVQLGEGASDTRRVARLSEIVARNETGEEVRAVLAPFAAPEARLVTVSELDGEPTYELAHEALIGSWDRLRTWLGHVPNLTGAEAIRGELRLRRRLRYAVETWRVDRSALMRPPELEPVKELRKRQPEELSTQEHEFIDASVRAWEAQVRWRRRARVLGLSALVVMALLGLVALRQSAEARRGRDEAAQQRDEARRQKSEAERQKANAVQNAKTAQERLAASYLEQGRALLFDGYPLRALAYFLAARQEDLESPVLRMWFARALEAVPQLTFEHRDTITAAVFSPDGARVVTASDDGTARVWDARTGKPATDPLKHRDAVNAAAFSPDGARIVTASFDGTARVWDARTGRPVADPLEHRDAVTAAAFSPDGARVVTASWDHTARVWNARTGKPVTGPLEHRDAVTAAAFSPDGARVVTASWDHTARVWDAGAGKPVTDPLAHRDSVFATAFSPDGARVVTASKDHTARVWDARTGRPVTDPLDHRDAVIAAAFSPDGTRVVTASVDHTARVWDARTGKPVTDLLEHRDRVWDAAFSPDGARVVTASVDRTARVWDVRTGKPIRDPLEHRLSVTAAAFSPDGQRVITASDDGTARVWDARTGKLLTEVLEHRDRVTAAAFSPDGTRVVTASDDGTARVWDARAGKPATDPLEHRDAVTAAAFSPDGARVVTGSADHTARVWDARTGKPATDPLEHRNRVTAVAFSPDGQRVVTASDDGTARVWDARTGKPVTAPLEHRAWVTAVAFSPDGTRVVTASANRTAWIWDAHTGKPVTDPLEHRFSVTAAAFSPDGARVVTASADGTARVWDAHTGKPVTDPLEHRDTVTAAAFSPDGARVVTASADRTARVWDAHTGKPVTDPSSIQVPSPRWRSAPTANA